MPAASLIRVVRSGLEESVHRGDIVAVDADGAVVASVGEPERLMYARSRMKPLQATVSLSLAPFDFTDREVAVMCASHNAEPVHLEAVRSPLARCGAPVHGMPLRSMATIYAQLVRPDRLGDLAPHAERAVSAMRAEPYMVAGRNRVDTAVMQASPDLVVKAGAEGLLCGAILSRGIAVSVKVRDGNSRAAGPALLRSLALLDVLDEGQLEELRPHARPDVLGGGRPVGSLVAEFDLTR